MQKNKLFGLLILLICEVVTVFLSENTEMLVVINIIKVLALQLLYNNYKHDFNKARNFTLGMILILLTDYIPVVYNVNYNGLSEGNLEFSFLLFNAIIATAFALIQLGYVYYLTTGVITISKGTKAEFLGEKLKKNLKYFVGASVVVAIVSMVWNLNFYLSYILGVALFLVVVIQIIIFINMYKIYLELIVKDKLMP